MKRFGSTNAGKLQRLIPKRDRDAGGLQAQAWIIRPTAWFTAASMVTTILHELVHACVAYGLGVRSTLFNYSVDVDTANAGATQRALIGISGPVFCLGLGVLAWLALRRARNSAAGLPLLYFTVFGLGTFFGNAMSISFVGDFSAVAAVLSIPMEARYAITVIGAISVAAIHFWGGRELVQWVPAPTGRLGSMAGMVVVPALLGTMLVILANQPMPWTSVTARFAEAAFWVFAAFGALTSTRRSQGSRGTLAVRWVDVAVVLLAVVMIRLMIRGIAFTP